MNQVGEFFAGVRQVIAELGALWSSHGTKLLGLAALLVASVLTVPDVIPPEHVRWWTLANAVLGALTVRRGFTNTARQP